MNYRQTMKKELQTLTIFTRLIARFRLGFKLIISFLGIMLIPVSGFALNQEGDFDGIPARPAFASGYVLNGYSVTLESANTLEFSIQHRFNEINDQDGGFDMFGIFGHASDIRLGMNYYPTDRLQVGIGATVTNLPYDLNWKGLLLQQTRDDAIPVSVAYAGNLAISVEDRPEFYTDTADRLSTYHELMVARRFGERLSLQLSGSYAYYSTVEEGMDDNNVALSARGRIGLTSSQNLLVEYELPLLAEHEQIEENDHDHQLAPRDDMTPLHVDPDDPVEVITPQPNLGLGWEYVTRGHEFQVFIANYNILKPQRRLLYHTNEIEEFDFLIGFNITRRWNL